MSTKIILENNKPNFQANTFSQNFDSKHSTTNSFCIDPKKSYGAGLNEKNSFKNRYRGFRNTNEKKNFTSETTSTDFVKANIDATFDSSHNNQSYNNKFVRNNGDRKRTCSDS